MPSCLDVRSQSAWQNALLAFSVRKDRGFAKQIDTFVYAWFLADIPLRSRVLFPKVDAMEYELSSLAANTIGAAHLV